MGSITWMDTMVKFFADSAGEERALSWASL